MLLVIVLSALLKYFSPVNYEIALAGNFAEPRFNHYHNGIDIKTRSVEGKAVLAVSEGYVSRVVIGLYGYGKAVFVHHPDGKTTMYCHLKELHPSLRAVVKRYQYSAETSAIDVHLQPNDYPVAAQQVIAMSGNTGASKAPHLHLELYETASGSVLDPLTVLSDYVKDTTPPTAHGFMAHPKEGEGVFCGNGFRQNFRLGGGTKRYTAWGKVGFSLWANDYADGAYNPLGVKKMALIVDGKEVFCSDITAFSPMDNRQVNEHGDYDFYLKRRVWFMKLYADEGLNLPFQQMNECRGVVDFNEERDYEVLFSLSDYYGNNSQYRCIVTGKRTILPTATVRKKLVTTARCDAMTTLYTPDAVLTIKPQSLADDTPLAFRERKQATGYSSWYMFSSHSKPLARWAKLAIRCKKDVDTPEKLYIKSVYTSRYCQSYYDNGYVVGYVRDIGQPYMLDYDDTPPIVAKPVLQRRRGQTVLRVGIYDKGSGLKSYKAYIDNRFVLLEHREKTSAYECCLNDAPIDAKNSVRELKIIATDNRNNMNTFTTHIIY